MPLFFALTVTGAYTLVYNLTEGVRRTRDTTVKEGAGEKEQTVVPEPAEEPRMAAGLPAKETLEPGSSHSGSTSAAAVDISSWRRSMWSPVGAGLLAGLFVAVIGNLDGIVQVAQGTWRKLADGRAFPPFDFWRSSRMLDFQENFDPSRLLFWVPDKAPGISDMSPHITEFPFFTFLFADLHAHMMVIPFTLLVIGLGLNLVVGLRSNSLQWTAVSATALALALGSLWVINSWDYPT